MDLVLVDYFINLREDLDTEVPEALSKMTESSLSFEVSKLFEYIASMSVEDLYLINISDMSKIKQLVRSPDKNISVSALVTIIDYRIPFLKLGIRL